MKYIYREIISLIIGILIGIVFMLTYNVLMSDKLCGVIIKEDTPIQYHYEEYYPLYGEKIPT